MIKNALDWRQMEFKLPRHTLPYSFIALLVLLIVALLSVPFVDFDIPTASDADESSGIVKAMEGRYSFRVMRRDDEGPAVYGAPHNEYSEVLVYGDYSPKEQDDICAVARAIRREVATKPIRLYFYPRELDPTGLKRSEVIE